MKTISIVIPCYNEADCIKLVYNELNKIFSSQLSQYQMQVIFVDDAAVTIRQRLSCFFYFWAA